jgi:hypothetical protein
MLVADPGQPALPILIQAPVPADLGNASQALLRRKRAAGSGPGGRAALDTTREVLDLTDESALVTD